MTNDPKKLLIESFDRPLTPAEQQSLDDAIAASPGLAEEKRRLVELRARMRSASAVAFKPFFSGRVMERLQPAPARTVADEFAGSLSYIFKRVATAGAFLALMLASYNTLVIPTEPEASAVEAVLALPPVNIETAFALDLP